MSTPSWMRFWRNSRPWADGTSRHDPGRSRPDRSGTAQGDHGDLVSVLLRHAVARHRSAVRHPVRHAVHPVRPLDPAWPVTPAARPPDPTWRQASAILPTPAPSSSTAAHVVQRRLASRAASMAAGRSRASRSISRSINMASRWRSTSRRRMSMTAGESSRHCISLPAVASKGQP